jgi:hypothetical protein
VRHGVSSPGRECEVESERAAVVPAVGVQRHADAVGGMRAPGGDPLEVVQPARGERVVLGGRDQAGDGENDHPFTLPAMMPWM